MDARQAVPEPQLTILTATWNRRHLLPRLYESLVSQDMPSGTFEWLVVDDGSTDGSADWLESLIPNAPFLIRVIRQENGGKHRALNRGMPEVRSEWVLIVDSDDWVLPGGIKQALEDIKRASLETLIVIAPREIVGRSLTEFNLTESLVNYAEWAWQFRRVGDTSNLMRTQTIQEYPFPDIKGEKFISESVVWSRAFKDGGVRMSNNRIVGCEYQPDGLTMGGRGLMMRNPVGAMLATRGRLEAKIGIDSYLRSSINYSRFYWHARRLKRSLPENAIPRNPLFLVVGYIRFLRDLWVLRRQTP